MSLRDVAEFFLLRGFEFTHEMVLPVSFSKLQILTKDGKPVTQWSDRDTAFLDVVQGIHRVVDSLVKK